MNKLSILCFLAVLGFAFAIAIVDVIKRNNEPWYHVSYSTKELRGDCRIQFGTGQLKEHKFVSDALRMEVKTMLNTTNTVVIIAWQEDNPL